MGKSEDLIEFIVDRPGHDFRYSLNSNRIRKNLSWKPTYRLEEGLRQTVEWYQKNREWARHISDNTFAISWKTR